MSDQDRTGSPAQPDGRPMADQLSVPQPSAAAPPPDPSQADAPRTGDPAVDEALASLDAVNPDDLDSLIEAAGQVLAILQARLGGNLGH